MTVGPDLPVECDPTGRNVELLRVEGAGPRLRRTRSRDQVGALEHLEVFGDCLLCHLERLGQLAYRRVALGQTLQDRAPGGVGQRREHQAQLIVNDRHTPTISTTARLHNQLVVQDARADLREGRGAADRGLRPMLNGCGECEVRANDDRSTRAAGWVCFTRDGPEGLSPAETSLPVRLMFVPVEAHSPDASATAEGSPGVACGGGTEFYVAAFVAGSIDAPGQGDSAIERFAQAVATMWRNPLIAC